MGSLPHHCAIFTYMTLLKESSKISGILFVANAQLVSQAAFVKTASRRSNSLFSGQTFSFKVCHIIKPSQSRTSFCWNGTFPYSSIRIKIEKNFEGYKRKKLWYNQVILQRLQNCQIYIIRDGGDKTSAVAIEGFKMIEWERATNPQSEKKHQQNPYITFTLHLFCIWYLLPSHPIELLLNKSLHIWYAMKLLQLLSNNLDSYHWPFAICCDFA